MLFGYTQPTALGLQSGFDVRVFIISYNRTACSACMALTWRQRDRLVDWSAEGQLICIVHPTGWTTGCKYVYTHYTVQLLGEGLDESNVFDSSNPSSNRWSNSQIFVYTIQSVGQPAGKPIVSCIRGFRFWNLITVWKLEQKIHRDVSNWWESFDIHSTVHMSGILGSFESIGH